MKQILDVEQALERVPGWDPAAANIEKLSGGLTNRVFLVRSNDIAGVLRLSSDDGAPGVDHSRELQILQSAAAAGLAPAIIYSDPDAGVLVTEHLAGRVWQAADLDETQNLEQLARLLRRVHALPKANRHMNPVELAVKYAQSLASRHGLQAFATDCVAVIRKNNAQASSTCCHNDVVASNVIEGGALWLIDWEYACDNDPLFDLASLIGYHDLADKQQQILLDAYAGGADNALKERLAEQVRLFDALQWLWLATRQLRSPHEAQVKRLEELRQRVA
ncbi:MAG: choline/ethanolamine kinase family protein [Woeseiaceae bacterium]|nr:choline/ethanolamine kinase family protein [Woeseiaceae bacterium]